ncbi:MAG: chromate transporter [Clostridia bacterium]|nr:chromate transporter [Clostridia bacterium]
MEKFKNSIKLFLTMFKIGLFTFGGGYAMLALLENEFVEKKGWLTKEEFLNMLAIGESTPGPIAINSATFIGYKTAGVMGSAFATLGVCLPSFIIIYIISLFFDAFLSLKFVEYAFLGIRACVVYLIASAGFKLFKSLKKNVLSIFIFASVLCVMTAFSVFAVSFSTVFYILICGTIGLAAYLISLISKKEAKK